MELLEQIVAGVNTFLWDFFLLILLCGTGVYFTLRLKFVQVKRLGEGLKAMFGGLRRKGPKATKDGMSSFQSLTTAIAAQVGIGNIAGAATAIAAGGPGAIFWMWASSFFGMATSFAEATLAQEYKDRRDGEVVGGPVYYIRAAFRGKLGNFLAGFFAIAIILALGCMGNMVQSNSIGEAFQAAFHIPPLFTGLLVSVLCGFIFMGGVQRIASVTERLVPFMAILYIVGCLIIIGVNYKSIFPALTQIFVSAFRSNAVFGGVAGVAVQKAIRFGVARGLFSNEAGMGSTPHAHALAKVKHPCEQGVAAMVGVFIDTFVMLTLTALVILTTGAMNSGATGSVLAQIAFDSVFGKFGNIFIAVSLFCFGFSSIIGWYVFGRINVKYLFGRIGTRIYPLVVMAFVVLGTVLQVDFVWSLSDLFNGMMVLPNLLGLLALGTVTADLLRDYDRQSKSKALGQPPKA